MKFGNFIRFLLEDVEGYNNQIDFICDLFESVNADNKDLDGKVKNWMAGINKSYRNYFKYIKFDDNGFINFLKDRTHQSWKNIQTGIKNNTDKRHKHIINIETNDVDVFFHSVLCQFKEIVGLPYGAEYEKILYASTPEQILETFYETIKEYDVLTFLKNIGSPESLTPDIINKVDAFFEVFKLKIKFLVRDDKNKKLCENVNEFANSFGALRRSSNELLKTGNAMNFTSDSNIDKKRKLEDKIDSYRERLLHLYNIIINSDLK